MMEVAPLRRLYFHSLTRTNWNQTGLKNFIACLNLLKAWIDRDLQRCQIIFGHHRRTYYTLYFNSFDAK
jgi:hypothetical protein